MIINKQTYCDECKRKIDENDDHDYIWLAKDGREYCDVCYDKVFYPKWFGFTRSDFYDGKAGYTMGKDGKTIKIHEDEGE